MNNTLKITFFGFVLYLIKWILIAIGAIATYYMVSLQVQYGVTSKVISEMISPTLHPDAMEKVYMPMTNKLLDTGDITMASVVRIPVADDLSNEDAI
jgi:signal peptidase I